MLFNIDELQELIEKLANCVAEKTAERVLASLPTPAPQQQEETYFTTNEVCDRYGTTKQSLWRWRKAGYLPKIKLGGSNRYRKSDLDRILAGKGGAA